MSTKRQLRTHLLAAILIVATSALGVAAAGPLTPVTPKSTATSSAPAAKAAAAGPTLKGLLDGAKIPYTKLDDGTFQIAVSGNPGQTATIVIWENPIGDDPQTKLVCFTTEVMELPKATPQKALDRIAQLNERMVMGRLGRSTDGSLMYRSSFWLRQADEHTVYAEFQIALQTREQTTKDLQAYLK